MSADVAGVDFYNEDSASPLTVSKPGAFAAGDTLVAVIVQHAPSSQLGDMTAPSGWAEKGSYSQTNNQGKVFTIPFSGGLPSTWDFPYYINADVCLALFRVTAADPAVTLVIASTTFASLGGSDDSPTLTPTGVDDLLICALANICSGTVLTETDPSTMTDRGQTQAATSFMALAVASQQLASSSATGVRTWTSVTPTGLDGATLSIAIKSAAPDTSTPPIPTPASGIPWAILQMLILNNANQWQSSPVTTAPDIAADLSVTATLSAATTKEAFPAAALTVTATQTAGVTKDAQIAATQTVTATLSAAAARIASASAAQTVTATLSAAVAKEVFPAAAQIVTATLSAGAAKTAPVDAAQTVTATLAAADAKDAPVNAAQTVTATLSAALTVAAAGKNIDAAQTVTVTLTAAPAREAAATATQPVTVTLTAAMARTAAAQALLNVTATLSAAQSVSDPLQAAMAVLAVLAASMQVAPAFTPARYGIEGSTTTAANLDGADIARGRIDSTQTGDTLDTANTATGNLAGTTRASAAIG